MANPIFSTYKNNENRVTSTILAVFERLNVATVTDILQKLMDRSELELITYINQIKSDYSVPDGRIKGAFDYLIETKIKSDSIDVEQINNHCKSIVENKYYSFTELLVLTPDKDEPRILKKNVKKEYKKIISWSNFDKLVDSIDGVLMESNLLLDREKFLLLELKEFIISEGLTTEDYSKKVLIVPAGRAWEFYEQYKVYCCQPNRYFKPTSYMGFYVGGEIMQWFPKIIGFVDNLNLLEDDLDNIEIKIVDSNMEESEIRNRLIELKKLLKRGRQPKEWNEYKKYILLTSQDSEDTYKIDSTIKNDKTSYSNKTTAFVQKQTYLNIDDLKGKEYTSQLEEIK